MGGAVDTWTTWEYRSAFDYMMDEIAAAESHRELDDLTEEVARTFAFHPRLDELHALIAAMRRLVAAEAVARRRGFTAS
jgi:hypothetical protein